MHDRLKVAHFCDTLSRESYHWAEQLLRASVFWDAARALSGVATAWRGETITDVPDASRRKRTHEIDAPVGENRADRVERNGDATTLPRERFAAFKRHLHTLSKRRRARIDE